MKKVIRVDILVEKEDTGKRILYSFERKDMENLLLIIEMNNLFDQLAKFKVFK